MIHSLQILRFVDPVDTQVFADRADMLESLVNQLVDAGNALREGRHAATKTLVVSGAVGVGKSALLFEALQALRDPSRSPRARRPVDPERWLQIYVSCKSLAGVPNLLSALRATLQATIAAVLDQSETPSRSLTYTVLDSLFGRQPHREATVVREALTILEAELAIARRYWGVTLKEAITTQSIDELKREVEAQFQVELAVKPNEKSAPRVAAALNRLSKFVIHHASKSTVEVTLEHQYTVGVDYLVEACNAFFESTKSVQIPTVIVIDDIDELLTDLGPDYPTRAKVLRALLGPLRSLAPTALLFGVRREYVDFDVRRVSSVIDVEPVRPADALVMLRAWIELLYPDRPEAEWSRVTAIGAEVLPRVEPEDRAVVPLRFFELVQHALNNRIDASDRPALLRAFMQSQGMDFESFDALRSTLTPDEQRRALRAQQIKLDDRHKSAIADGDREQMVTAGLIRPESAADGATTSDRVLLDPLFGYLVER